MGLLGRARDAQQVEVLLRKYFRRGDVYVHSDLQNSTVVIIKNIVEGQMVPPGTVSQAGVMAVATSRAWEVKQGRYPTLLPWGPSRCAWCFALSSRFGYFASQCLGDLFRV